MYGYPSRARPPDCVAHPARSSPDDDETTPIPLGQDMVDHVRSSPIRARQTEARSAFRGRWRTPKPPSGCRHGGAKSVRCCTRRANGNRWIDRLRLRAGSRSLATLATCDRILALRLSAERDLTRWDAPRSLFDRYRRKSAPCWSMSSDSPVRQRRHAIARSTRRAAGRWAMRLWLRDRGLPTSQTGRDPRARRRRDGEDALWRGRRDSGVCVRRRVDRVGNLFLWRRSCAVAGGVDGAWVGSAEDEGPSLRLIASTRYEGLRLLIAMATYPMTAARTSRLRCSPQDRHRTGADSPAGAADHRHYPFVRLHRISP